MKKVTGGWGLLLRHFRQLFFVQMLASFPLALLLLVSTPFSAQIDVTIVPKLVAWAWVAWWAAFVTYGHVLAQALFWRRKPGPLHYLLANLGWGPKASRLPAWLFQFGLTLPLGVFLLARAAA